MPKQLKAVATTTLCLVVQTGRGTCEAKEVQCTAVGRLLLCRMWLLLPGSCRGLRW